MIIFRRTALETSAVFEIDIMVKLHTICHPHWPNAVFKFVGIPGG